MNRSVVVVVKVLIAVLLAVVVGALVWFAPWASGEMARTYPEFQDLRAPLLVLSEIVLAGALAVLACLWALLTRVSRGRIFDRSSLGWVRAMTISTAVVSAACAVSLAWIPGPPLLGFGVLLAALGCAGLALILVVMRGLLVQAASEHAELEVVI